MLNDLTCPLCSEPCLTKDNEYAFVYDYKGFSELIGCNLTTCLNCKEDIQQTNDKAIEEAKSSYEAYVDSLIVQFYLYNDVNVNKTFKHYKKGTIYQLLLISNLESTDQNKFPTTAVYQDVDTKLVWSRPLVEFITNFKIQG